MVKKKIIWDIAAKDYLKKAIAHIKKDSLQNGEMVKDTILASISNLSKLNSVLIHAIDTCKNKNDGNYRYYLIFKFRISYFIGKDHIRIVRIRHSSQEPELY
jgi:plasmid stabilization system protein ParE